MTYIYGHNKPYQTQRFPDGRETEGVRGLERWDSFLSQEDFTGYSIVEFGCSLSMDGILAVATGGARCYHGFEQDVQSIALAHALAHSWKLHVAQWKLTPGDLAKGVPQTADVLWMFSVAGRIPLPVLYAQALQVDSTRIYIESHMGDDAATSTLLSMFTRFDRQILGKVPASIENQTGQRTLYCLTRKRNYALR